METLAGWLKKPVIITLNTEIPAPMHGTLIEIGERWLTLQQGQRRLVICVQNVLHVAFDPE